MIFYLATEASGRKVLCGTQVDAKKIDKDFEQVDVPVDKKGLMEFVQESLNMVFELSKSQPTASAPAEPKLILTDGGAASFEARANESREAERAEFMGVSRDVLNMSDKIGDMDGWPLGQIAAAVTSRIAELSKPYVEAPAPIEDDGNIAQGGETPGEPDPLEIDGEYDGEGDED